VPVDGALAELHHVAGQGARLVRKHVRNLAQLLIQVHRPDLAVLTRRPISCRSHKSRKVRRRGRMMMMMMMMVRRMMMMVMILGLMPQLLVQTHRPDRRMLSRRTTRCHTKS
jgi:hypothetical protein